MTALAILLTLTADALYAVGNVADAAGRWLLEVAG